MKFCVHAIGRNNTGKLHHASKHYWCFLSHASTSCAVLVLPVRYRNILCGAAQRSPSRGPGQPGQTSLGTEQHRLLPHARCQPGQPGDRTKTHTPHHTTPQTHTHRPGETSKTDQDTHKHIAQLRDARQTQTHITQVRHTRPIHSETDVLSRQNRSTTSQQWVSFRINRCTDS